VSVGSKALTSELQGFKVKEDFQIECARRELTCARGISFGWTQRLAQADREVWVKRLRVEGFR